ncbi:SIR2 family NAD-dependent protein deacylase [Pseudomonas chlororaphis]|uniref:SIR2 family NAD-dependent protein deacylase n=1 Tax=Pseudomonas chlororaphis TaxID=587753 RepID=UPI000D10ED8E|nr:SIR2 family protein [Pseudomonas chlororaphis]AVO61030.1 hypothetical protein C6Q18_24760 [Pseudomonas chlororaphis subsp. piscium]
MENSRVHYDAVRRALANGNAAIMVGAGFSRNAENGDQLATWGDVARELWRELNPDRDEIKDFSTSMVTQLGEQYTRVFSKPALEDLLKRLIPDDRVSPGSLHKKLLALQWCEVFTTNYDTLLERASESIVDHAHYVVTCREDIPQSKMLNRRRIVKLHGSFPSQRPFIFTEEDYRKYPDLSAPFVNLVRQSILENVFCLIGFSGDDPNFLHWIGWVRDVLDQHALPIYLFLGTAPTLGQQKLLESRRVTPVVLPIPSGVEESDYASRYNELIEILGEPLNPDHNSWGDYSNKVPSSNFQLKDDEKWKFVLDGYLDVRKLRDSYPGWFVAPKEVRRRFSYTIARIPAHLYSIGVQEYVVENAPHVGIALMAEYAWHNDVLLQCFDDGLAEFSMRLLDVVAETKFDLLATEIDAVRAFSILSQASFDERRKELLVSLARWARQELRFVEYEKLCKQLSEDFPRDLQLKDELIYEDALLALYKGDRDVAAGILKDWEVKSADGYMFVRKGMLLGEVGDVSFGLTTSLIGLKKIRRNQRTRSGSVYYLSQEAWACQAISYLLDTLSWSTRFENGGHEVQFEINTEELDQRLANLAAINHDVVRELQLLIADLNAEAPPPSQPVSRTPLFEIGHYSTSRHIGRSSSLDKKIDSAFAWLSLSDRVSLVPRVGDTTFDIGAFGQAAWWVQYSDSMERVLSVMIRTLNKKMLSPRGDNQLLHAAGWLSRYQVARVKEKLALSICERSLSLVERVFDSAQEDNELNRVAGFHLEVVGRLIIRITDSATVLSFGERIVALHFNKNVSRYSDIWRSFAVCLSRCLENLSLRHRESLSRSIAMIPCVVNDGSVRSVYLDNWVMYQALRKLPGDSISNDVGDEIFKEVDSLISVLKRTHIQHSEREEGIPAVTAGTWRRLFWLNEWGFVSATQVKEIGEFLGCQEEWPIIPGHQYWAPLVWMPDENKKRNLDFKKWLFQQEVVCFRVVNDKRILNGDTRISWRMGAADEFFISLHSSMERISWSARDFAKALLIIKRWWDDEWPLIVKDVSRITDLKEMVVGRLDWLDMFVSKFIDKFGRDHFEKLEGVFDWFSDVQKDGSALGASFLRTRIATSFSRSEDRGLALVEKELIEGILSTDMVRANYALSIVMFWIKHPGSKKQSVPLVVVHVLVGIISTRRMPALSKVLEVMAEIVRHQKEWITKNDFSLISIGLEVLYEELEYQSRPDGTGIPDESVPELRIGCLKLAKALELIPNIDIQNVASLWINSASNDPLPELRYFTR